MKKFIRLTLLFLYLYPIMSCSPKAVPTPPTRTPEPRPSVKIGEITVEEFDWMGRRFPDLISYCGFYVYSGKTPGTETVDCEVPYAPRIQMDFGWSAKDAPTLEANWNAMTWELYIDETLVDPYQFQGWYDETKGRGWVLDIVNLTPGKHTIRLLWKSDVPIDDGSDVYPAGTYEKIMNITVQEGYP